MSAPFRTLLEDCALAPFGCHRMPSGVYLTRIAPVDTKNPGMFARMYYDDKQAFAKGLGGRLMSKSTLIELTKVGHRLEPYIMPTKAQRKAMPPMTGEMPKAYEARIRRDMASREWCVEHDAAIWARARDTAGYGSKPNDELPPVINDGKYDIDGAPDGYHRMMGGLKTNGTWWQPDAVNHKGRTHTDYWTLFRVEFDHDPGGSLLDARVSALRQDEQFSMFTLPPEHVNRPPEPHPFSAALLAAAIADIGVREQGGRNRGPEVDAWLRAAGIQPPANWCSVSVMKWLRDAARVTGLPMPIPGSPGARATMAQLQKVNRWYTGAEALRMFRPGCIVVWWRNRIDSWEGHIGIGESLVYASDIFTTIEGNSGTAGDRVAPMVRRWDDPQLLGIGLVD